MFRSLTLFILAGVTGFAVDCGLLLLLLERGFALLHSRLLSFGCAMAVTGFLHRHFTFPLANRMPVEQQAQRHAVVQCLGAATNFAVFFVLQKSFPVLQQQVAITLAMSAVVSLLVTFTLSRKWVFSPVSQQKPKLA